MIPRFIMTDQIYISPGSDTIGNVLCLSLGLADHGWGRSVKITDLVISHRNMVLLVLPNNSLTRGGRHDREETDL